mgnify:CR=1 FL=1
MPYARCHRTFAKVDLDAITHNLLQLQMGMKPGVKTMAVVKADAYGHGASKLAPLYQQMGADWFAVSNIEEALQLRRFGITRPVLILGYTPAACAEILAREDFSQCVYSAEYGRQLSAAAVEAGVTVKVHIKLDTGMGRLGFRIPGESEDSVEGAIAVCRLPGLVAEGVKRKTTLFKSVGFHIPPSLERASPSVLDKAEIRRPIRWYVSHENVLHTWEQNANMPHTYFVGKVPFFKDSSIIVALLALVARGIFCTSQRRRSAETSGS